MNFIYAEMLQRLTVRDDEKPEAARKRFDGQLGVHAWHAPGHETPEPAAAAQATPWWWNQTDADQSSQVFMEMARAKGMVE